MIKGKSCGSCLQQHFLAGLVGVLGRLAPGWHVRTLHFWKTSARVRAPTSDQDGFDLMQELGSLLRPKNVHQLFWAGLDAFIFGSVATWTNGPDYMHFDGFWGGLGLHHLNGISMTECHSFWQDWLIFISVDLVFGGFWQGLGLYLLKEIAMI